MPNTPPLSALAVKGRWRATRPAVRDPRGSGWRPTSLAGLFDDLARPLEPAERCAASRNSVVDFNEARSRSIESCTWPRPVWPSPLLRPQWDALRQRRQAVQGELNAFEAGVDRKYGAAAGRPDELAQIQRQLPADAALVAWVDIRASLQAADPNGQHWACLVRSQGESTWVKLGGSGPRGTWTPDDDLLSGKVTAGLHARPERNGTPWKTHAGPLSAQRLDPLDAHLGPRDGLLHVRNLVASSHRPGWPAYRSRHSWKRGRRTGPAIRSATRRRERCSPGSASGRGLTGCRVTYRTACWRWAIRCSRSPRPRARLHRPRPITACWCGGFPPRIGSYTGQVSCAGRRPPPAGDARI